METTFYNIKCGFHSKLKYKLYVQYLQERAALFGKPGKGKAIAKKAPAKTRKGNVSSDYDSDSEDISESEGSDIK